MKVVFVLVDALRSSYLNEETMPFLYNLSQKSRYIKKILASPGFCERSEIFTGLDCYESGNFSAIGYYPSKSVYKKYGVLLFLANLLSKISEKYTRFFFLKLRKRLGLRMNPYLIPYNSLKKFVLTEDGPDRFVQYKTIEDSLSQSNKTYSFDCFTSLSDLSSRTKLTIEEFLLESINEKLDFVPLYVGMIDAMGHAHGDSIDEMKPYLYDIDCLLKKLYTISSEKGYAFAVLGDHGMVPVIKHFNVIDKVAKTGLKIGDDFEMFVDSTSVRFWFFNEFSKKKLLNLLHSNDFTENGIVVEQDNAQLYRIPLYLKSDDGKPIYGDVVWCANPGVLISPDYFHSDKEKIVGMHGYLTQDCNNGTGLFVAHIEDEAVDVLESAPLYTICDELCRLLEIEVPNQKTKKIC